MTIAPWFGALFLLGFPVPGTQNSARNLDQYLSEIKTANPAYLASKKRWQASLQQADIASALPDPSLSLGVFVREVETRVGPQKQRLGIKQAIPWKGKRGLKGNLSREAANRIKAETEALALQLETEFKKWYADFYYLDKSIATTSDHLNLLKDLEAVVTERYQTNSAHYNDLIRIQIEIEALSDRLRNQQRSKAPVSAAMNALLGRPVNQAFPPVTALPALSIPKEWSEATLKQGTANANPDLKAIHHQIEENRIGIDLAKTHYYPDFHFGLDWINTGTSILPNTPDGGKDPIILSVGMNLPIQRKKYKAMGRAAAFQLAASEQKRKHVQSQLDARLQRAMFLLDDANRKMALYRDQIIPKAQESLNVTMRGFQTGDTSYQDLIDAEKMLLEFLLSLNLAESNRFKAAAAMEAILGEPPFAARSKE